MTGVPTYPDCAHIKRPSPVLNVNEQIATAIGKDFRVLPLFEKTIYEYSYKRYYSLNNNEFLKCRWQSYVKHFEERTFAPFVFIVIRDVVLRRGNSLRVINTSAAPACIVPKYLMRAETSDFHFYNSLNRLQPSESIHKKKDYRYRLKVGPGVDFCGQMPIPQDLLMKRGVQKPIPKPKRYSKTEAEILENKIKKGI